MRTEANLEKTGDKLAKEGGWRPRKVKYEGRRGAPDKWYFKAPGRLKIVEWKDPNGALSPAQRREINWLRENGFDVAVCDNIADFLEFLEAPHAPA